MVEMETTIGVAQYADWLRRMAGLRANIRAFTSCSGTVRRSER